jgi:hypothetical protein
MPRLNGNFSNVNVQSARSFNNKENEFFQKTTANTKIAMPRKKLERNIKKNRKLFYILLGLGVLITVGIITTLIVIFVGKNIKALS